MSRRAGMFAVILATLTTGMAWAHDGHAHKIMGTVTARGVKHVEVKTPSGEVLSIALTGKTATLRDKKTRGNRVRCALPVRIGRMRGGADPCVSVEPARDLIPLLVGN